ncbi:DM13 domain-containing protein [Galbibacter sp. PAP.153]|uniref:DM13 domain-containing protein n=1 Tax=Galbibacter sp. PAP.153 TaxID=3104623 RepID=UPI00300BDAFC
MKTTVFTFLLFTLITSSAYTQNGNQWVEKVYNVKGNWSITEKNGQHYFRLGSNFNTLAGPNLKLYLSPLKMSEIKNREAIDKEGGVLIAELKSNKGSQQYKLPEDINLTDYKSIVIHCQQFAVVWGGVDIEK